METIGVTAGASTPRWTIKNVVRELESIRGQKETSRCRGGLSTVMWQAL